jgi:hypothetical protein
VIDLTTVIGIEQRVSNVCTSEAVVYATGRFEETPSKESVLVSPESPVSLIASGLVDFGRATTTAAPLHQRRPRRSWRSYLRRAA